MRGAGGTRRQRREHGSIKSRARTDLELPVRREEFPAVMVLQAVLGFVDSVTFQELSFRAERGVCCARERQRARFLATRGMTSSKRSQIIFVSEIALVSRNWLGRSSVLSFDASNSVHF